MKSGRVLLFLFLSLFFLISGCQDPDPAEKKGDYSTVSNLIADRNRARKDAPKNVSDRKSRPAKSLPEKSDKYVTRDDELASVILYEQEIKIVGFESGRTIATGVAYINKKGQIVKITVSKE